VRLRRRSRPPGPWTFRCRRCIRRCLPARTDRWPGRLYRLRTRRNQYPVTGGGPVDLAALGADYEGTVRRCLQCMAELSRFGPGTVQRHLVDDDGRLRASEGGPGRHVDGGAAGEPVDLAALGADYEGAVRGPVAQVVPRSARARLVDRVLVEGHRRLGAAECGPRGHVEGSAAGDLVDLAALGADYEGAVRGPVAQVVPRSARARLVDGVLVDGHRRLGAAE